MKKLAVLALAVLTLVGLSSLAAAVCIDFEDIAAGEYASIVYPGVTFTNNFTNDMDKLTVWTYPPGPPLSGHCVLGPVSHNYNEWYKATFSVALVRFVSVDMGDYNADADHLYLKAYDAADNLLATDYQINAATTNGGLTLSVSTSVDIAYVLFNQMDPYPGSVWFDNFCYTQIPVPGALLLFGSGLAALAVWRRK